MKRMLPALLVGILILVLLPLHIFAGAQEDNSDLEYQIRGIKLIDENDEEANEIPEGVFKAVVVIRPLEGAEESLLLVAAYTEKGQYLGLTDGGNIDQTTTEVEVSIDNTEGRIGQIKAFIVRSQDDMMPLGEVVLFGTALYNDGEFVW